MSLFEYVKRLWSNPADPIPIGDKGDKYEEFYDILKLKKPTTVYDQETDAQLTESTSATEWRGLELGPETLIKSTEPEVISSGINPPESITFNAPVTISEIDRDLLRETLHREIMNPKGIGHFRTVSEPADPLQMPIVFPEPHLLTALEPLPAGLLPEMYAITGVGRIGIYRAVKGVRSALTQKLAWDEAEVWHGTIRWSNATREFRLAKGLEDE